MSMDKFEKIDALLEKPYWLIDLLPKQVPASSHGQYFEIEQHFLSQLDTLCQKFFAILVKLNCYFDIQANFNGEDWTLNPTPENLESLMNSAVTLHSPIYILIGSEDALVTFSGDDHYMTLYNPDTELLELVRLLASSEGLFVWSPYQKNP